MSFKAHTIYDTFKNCVYMHNILKYQSVLKSKVTSEVFHITKGDY